MFYRAASGKAERPRISQNRGFPHRLGRRHPRALRSAILHGVPEPLACGFHHGMGSGEACRKHALSSRALRHRCERGKNAPSLQGAFLPHQSAAPRHRAVDSPLHRAWRHRARRLQRIGPDGRGGAMVRRGTGQISCGVGKEMEGRRSLRAEMGRAALCAERPFTDCHLHFIELQSAFRRKDVRIRRPEPARRCRARPEMDVRNPAHRRKDQGAH